MNYWIDCVCDRCGEKERVYQPESDPLPLSDDWCCDWLCMRCFLVDERDYARDGHVIDLPLGTWLRRYTERANRE